MMREGLRARAKSLVFGVPVLLSLALFFLLIPDTLREWELWRSGVSTTGAIRHGGPNLVYLEYEPEGRRYSTGGYQKQGSEWLSLPDGHLVRLTYLPSNPEIVELGDPGSKLAALVTEGAAGVVIIVLWLRFAWPRWLTGAAGTTTG